jgi:GH25 family lysozyme M1 (1,4-beta-N-acetylmuramidase)
LNKRLITFAASLTLAAITTFNVAAQTVALAQSTVSDIYQSEDSSYNNTLELYASDADDDPSYWKYYENSQLVSTESNALTFNSKYANCEKTWGIDVSKYQGTIDWNKVKNSGIDYVIIRVGFRGYGTGALCSDTMFDTYIKGAVDAGLDIGVYFFSQAITTTEAKEEADFVASKIKNYKLSYPVYIDMEDVSGGRFDKANLTKAQKTSIADTFCNEMESLGYASGVYANKYWLTSVLDSSSLEKNHHIWLANYTTNTTYSGEYQTWQYTSTGTVKGISGYVDGDVHFVTEKDNFNSSDLNSSSTETTTTDTTETVETTEPVSVSMIGDPTRDGNVDSRDATFILVYFSSTLCGKESELDTIEQQVIDADVNLDGKVNSIDATIVLCYAAYHILNNDITFVDYMKEFNQITYDTTLSDETEESTEVETVIESDSEDETELITEAEEETEVESSAS